MFLKRSPRGKIVKPKNGSLVSRLFQAKGTIGRLPEGQHLFLVIQVGGLLWPKAEVRLDGTSWTAEVHEGGAPPNGEFALSLYSVGGKGYDEVTDWLDRGDSTGLYPGLRRIKDGTRLHNIELRLEPPSRL